MLNQVHGKTNKKYKLINFRTVKDLITAEFLHDLYNQHRHLVNSIRFRNTLCVLRGNDFKSYAPQKEWDLLEKEFGRRLFQRDSFLISEIEKYILLDKKALLDYMEFISQQIEGSSVEDLYDFLSRLHYVALGEIYGINLVQIEHGVTWAISQYLHLNPKDFSHLPSFDWKSKFQEQEEFLLQSSIRISELAQTYEDFLQQYQCSFSSFANGYGSGVEENLNVSKRMDSLLLQDMTLRKKELNSLKAERNMGFASCEYYDLYQLASQIGELRDKNKFLMGKVASIREQLLVRIGLACQISREDLSRYALIDINRLIFDKQVLSEAILAERRQLVVFKREEYFCSDTKAESDIRFFISDLPDANRSLLKEPVYGTVASEGIVRGNVKIVTEANDCSKVGSQDIVVAFGTDFDLMPAIASCAGVITEEGGILSHASVVTRELQKPCLINVPHVMTLLKEDDAILLNCEKGYFVVETPSQSTNFCFDTLETLLGREFGLKTRNLSLLRQHKYNVLPGICFSSSVDIPIEDKSFFIELSKCIHGYLSSSNIIIRSSSPLEDQNQFSYAGLFCSRAIQSDLSSLQHAFREVFNKIASLKNYDITNAQKQNGILIQPYISFSLGGVTFTNLHRKESQKVIVEMSTKGSFGVVNGEVDSRQIFSLDEIQQSHQQEEEIVDAQYFTRQSAQIAANISALFGFDVDVEWGVYNNEIWILQAREVTKPCVA